MKQLQQLRKGSTNLLIMNALQNGEMYGYEIMRQIEAQSDGYFGMTAAVLYPALHRLEEAGWVQARWVGAEGTRRRKYYTLTESGKVAYTEKQQVWQEFVGKLQATLGGPADAAGGVSVGLEAG